MCICVYVCVYIYIYIYMQAAAPGAPAEGAPPDVADLVRDVEAMLYCSSWFNINGFVVY